MGLRSRNQDHRILSQFTLFQRRTASWRGPFCDDDAADGESSSSLLPRCLAFAAGTSPRPRDPTRQSPRAPLSRSSATPGALPMASSSTWNFPFRAGDWWVRDEHAQGLLQSPCVILTTPRPPLPLVSFHFCHALKEQVPAADSKEIRNLAAMNTVTCTHPSQPPAGWKRR